jgi:dephospho-CoA kinase
VEQITRTMARSGLTEDMVRAIMATQTTRAARRAAANDILSNSADQGMLEAQVIQLDDLYRRLAMAREQRS